MTSRKRCATCVWWQAGGPPRATHETLPGHPEMFLGACTVNPPFVVGNDPHTAASMFPRTHENRCCGWWEARGDGGPDDGERVHSADVVDISDRIARSA